MNFPKQMVLSDKNNHPVYTMPSHVLCFSTVMCLVSGWVRQAAVGHMRIYIYYIYLL